MEKEEGGNGLCSLYLYIKYIHIYIYLYKNIYKTHTHTHTYVFSQVAVTIQIHEHLIVAVLKLRHVKISFHPRLPPYFLLYQSADISDLILSVNC